MYLPILLSLQAIPEFGDLGVDLTLVAEQFLNLIKRSAIMQAQLKQSPDAGPLTLIYPQLDPPDSLLHYFLRLQLELLHREGSGHITIELWIIDHL